MIERPTFPTNVRKCPRHKCWIQAVNSRSRVNGEITRYCPRCDIEYAQALHKLKQDAGQPVSSPLKVMKL